MIQLGYILLQFVKLEWCRCKIWILAFLHYIADLQFSASAEDQPIQAYLIMIPPSLLFY